MPPPRPTAAAAALAAVSVVSGCGTGSAASSGAASTHGVEPEPVADRPSSVLIDTEARSDDVPEETDGRPTYVTEPGRARARGRHRAARSHRPLTTASARPTWSSPAAPEDELPVLYLGVVRPADLPAPAATEDR